MMSELESDLDDKKAVNSISDELGSDDASTDCFKLGRPATAGDTPQKSGRLVVTSKNIWERINCLTKSIGVRYYQKNF